MHKPIVIRDTVRAAHLILTGYGHWLPNDPRGSGSTEIRKHGLEPFGPIHFGRKCVQPPRSTLKEFYQSAESMLEHETIWFDERARLLIGDSIGAVSTRHSYTFYACAVLRNHLHLITRTHRDDSITMLSHVALESLDALRSECIVPDDHPVWAHRPYKVYMKTREEIRGRIHYVNENPMKEGLPPQKWDFVVPF